MSLFRFQLLPCLALLWFAGPSVAAPWIEPGDNRMRHSLQVLSDQGHLDTPLNTWPIMWSGVTQGANLDRSSWYGAEQDYLRFEAERFARTGWKAQWGLGASTQPPMVRGFGAQPREHEEVSLRVDWSGEEWAFGLSGTYANDPSDEREWRADGSYIAYTGNNWTLGVGAIDRWWGPGWHSALVLSSNARPVPSIWLNRTNPRGSDHPLLAWLGPWQFTVLAGELEGSRAQSDARLIGMRFNARPLSGLEVGASRLMRYGGGNEPGNASALWDTFKGAEPTGSETDASATQMAAVDFRYGNAWRQYSGGVYGEFAGHWNESASVGRFIGLAGVDLAFPVGDASQRWFVEYADTTAGNLFANARDNVTYEDALYRTGSRYRGRALGSTFDGDALAATLGLQHYLADGRDLTLSLSHVRLNRSGSSVFEATDGDVDYFVSRRSRDTIMLQGSYAFPLWGGRATLDGQWTDRRVEIQTADGSGRAQGTLTLGWQYRF